MIFPRSLLDHGTPTRQIWLAAAMPDKLDETYSLNDIIKTCDDIINSTLQMPFGLSGILLDGMVHVYKQKAKLLHEEVLQEARDKLVNNPNILPRPISAARSFDVSVLDQHALLECNENLIGEDLAHQDHEENIEENEATQITLQNPEKKNKRKASKNDEEQGKNKARKARTRCDDPSYIGPRERTKKQLASQIVESVLDPNVVQLPDLQENTRQDPYVPMQCNEEGRKSLTSSLNSPSRLTSGSNAFPEEQPAEDINGPESVRNTTTNQLANLPDIPTQDQSDLSQPDNTGGFDVEGDEQMQFASDEHEAVNLSPAPFPLEETHNVQYETVAQIVLNEQDNMQQESEPNQRHEEAREHSQIPQNISKKKANIIDGEPSIAPRTGCGGRSIGQKKKQHADFLLSQKVKSVLFRPNVVQLPGLVGERHQYPYFPEPLNEEWRESLTSSLNSAHNAPAAPSSSSADHTQNTFVTPAEDINGTESSHNTTTNQLANLPDIPMQEQSDLSQPDNTEGFDVEGVEQMQFSEGYAPENAYTNMTTLLGETGRTQTQHPVLDEVMEYASTMITVLKTRFEGTEATQPVSFNDLTTGKNREQAAQMFYQICVLATEDYVKVEQTDGYGDILIFKGAKMRSIL